MSRCCEYAGAKNKGGYGVRWFRGKTWPAHRAAWVEANGEIPAGMLVLHSCDNPPCVNVEHLRLGTHLDNEKDKVSRGRQARQDGEHNGYRKLSAEDVKTIRAMALAGASRVATAKAFNVSQGAVSMIVNRQRWANT